MTDGGRYLFYLGGIIVQIVLNYKSKFIIQTSAIQNMCVILKIV